MEMRNLTPEDYDDIVRVWTESDLPYKPRGRDTREEIARQMALDPDMFLGAYADGELVGVIMGSYDSRKGWINRLAVVPGHRRRGIARALVEEMEERLRARGFRIIAALIEDHSPESMELFSAVGYTRHDDIHYYTKRDHPDI